MAKATEKTEKITVLHEPDFFMLTGQAGHFRMYCRDKWGFHLRGDHCRSLGEDGKGTVGQQW